MEQACHDFGLDSIRMETKDQEIYCDAYDAKLTVNMMNNLITHSYPKGYGLFLSDGNNWWITGDNDSIKIVDELATIMELEEYLPDGLSKLIFFSSKHKHGIKSFKSNLSNLETGWKFYDHETVHIWYHINSGDILFELKNDIANEVDEYEAMWLSLQPIYRRSVQMGGLPFHAGLVECERKGVLLAAQGGTGKSTCCRRLPNYWKTLCDDQVLIALDKSKDYRVHPFPTWKDLILSDNTIKRVENSWDVQRSVPLSAIFFLEQSEKDEVIPISAKKAPLFMVDSATQSMEKNRINITSEERIELVREVYNNAFDIAKVTPTFHLRVSRDGRFWEEIEKAIGL